MTVQALSSWMLAQEARALLTRLARVKPFALQETMVPAAALSDAAQTNIENFLAEGRRELRSLINGYINWIESPQGRRMEPETQQRRFTFLRLRFNVLLSQVDIFSDVITQRSEHGTGVRLAGLDVVAADALRIPGNYYNPPPVICYVDRGQGAAIRRAKTRLPGGRDNPVAVIRIPRERMVGSGIGSSLIHEVGHQAAALLDLINSLRPILKQKQLSSRTPGAWVLWERWISEIVADFWSVAKLGISSTNGLMAVVSLPRAFVFRISLDDPHPFPWIRVKLSCAMGAALYPHPQWQRFSELWEAFYPRAGLDRDKLAVIQSLEREMPEFVELLTRHRPARLRGSSLAEAVTSADRRPERLAAYWNAWQAEPDRMRRAPPALTMAVLGQARANGKVTPALESRTLGYLLTWWALARTLRDTAACAARPPEISLPVRAASAV
jgi:hypothetical protein